MKFPAWTTLTIALLVPQIAWAQSEQQHIITMSGHGEARARPDTAMLSAGVNVDAPTAAAALATGNREMEAVLAVLKKMSVPDGDVQTRNFSVQPQYANASGEAPHVTGYHVSNQVQVRLEDIDRLGTMLDALVAAGANQVGGVQFSVRDPAGLVARARADAVNDARAKAETFAKAAGVTLGPLLSVREEANQAPRPVFMLARSSDVPVALGEESIGADVTIVWEIK